MLKRDWPCRLASTSYVAMCNCGHMVALSVKQFLLRRRYVNILTP